ncbi:lipoyl(octanoyl) transferase LipB [Wenzhouxiangella sp. AB-CW3]|uniref:lipoyl(octanoyl) transferase LipB n=1 Tax=Wenzhouxiangella sp. AB-CW3 TaxID=2771012 RepID=UPI00168B36AB|nr:lipoyl(octanoyl) transferase LipB [Wenzhouxiangella sp. AB-CW3]QOC22798.1 lipoyl(octanoyl) transferase LipB [Wenzhouxiangella sp. AB-CW3]
MVTSCQSAKGSARELLVRHLGRQPYETVWAAMRDFTDERDESTADELWLVEHDPVFTQGLAGKPEHLINPGNIPVVQTDRGGQVTYHGPGQVVAYPLLDLERLGVGVRCLVDRLEQAVIDVLAGHAVVGTRKDGAPGVFVDAAKIASIGLKVRRGRTYHGLAFNVDMDLTPFSWINPCGFAGLEMTQVSAHVPEAQWQDMADKLVKALAPLMGYHRTDIQDTMPEKLRTEAVVSGHS